MASKTISEQIADLEATRDQKSARMKEVVQKSLDEGRSTNTAEAEEFDTLEAEVKTINDDLVRLRKLERLEAASAKGVEGEAKAKANAPANSNPVNTVQVKHTEKLEPGMGFARFAKCKAVAFTERMDPAQIAKSLYPDDERLHKSFEFERVNKTAVPAANTGNATWAGNLALDGGAYFADFVTFLRERSLLGQISSRLRNVPMDTNILVQGSGGSADWVKEGANKPLTQWTYTNTKVSPFKVAAIAAATEEMLRRASVSAETLIRDELARSVNAAIDSTFASASAAVSGESPAGIFNGTTPLTLSGGSTVEDIRCDVATYLNAILADNKTLGGAFWIMPESVAVNLSLVANEVGATAFPGITPTGGTFAGLPVFTSGYVPTDSSGAVVALVKGDEIFLGDEGGIRLSVSDQASLVMDDSPTGNSTTPTAANVVSMWQTNSVAFRCERFISWAKRRSGSVAWGYVNWSACNGSP